jgi:organic radical activating enzyme
MHTVLGGGLYSTDELVEWTHDYEHICLTGGEPLDRDLSELIIRLAEHGPHVTHIETSGTKRPDWLSRLYDWRTARLWLTVSPKPGWLPAMITLSDEIKIIYKGLGDGPGWPTLDDAIRWAQENHIVYLQPRNSKFDIDMAALDEVTTIVKRHPSLLRLSVQQHKFLRVR